MLKPACRRFRAAFELGADAPHRQACVACESWAETLESAAQSVVRRPLPSTLAQRLRDIPRRRAQCDQRDRLYRAAKVHSRGGTPEPGVIDHLEQCAPCRALYETLATALKPYRFPLSETLSRRLKTEIPQQPRRSRTPDVWQGLAACCLLSIGLIAAAPQLAEPLSSQSGRLRPLAADWMASSATVGQQTWGSIGDGLGAAYGYTRDQVNQLAELGGRLAETSGVAPATEDLLKKIEQTLKSGGDKDERAGRNSS